jgi:hypothetical protein
MVSDNISEEVNFSTIVYFLLSGLLQGVGAMRTADYSCSRTSGRSGAAFVLGMPGHNGPHLREHECTTMVHPWRPKEFSLQDKCTY